MIDNVTPGKWSCFVLNDDGTWEQPTFRVKREMSEGEFQDIVLTHFDRNHFAVYGVDRDEEADDEFAKDLEA